jgi:predicted nucleic acid-binding protein
VIRGNAQHQAEEFAASVVSLAEIYVGAARANRLADVERAIARLNVAAVALPATAARRLAEIPGSHELEVAGLLCHSRGRTTQRDRCHL